MLYYLLCRRVLRPLMSQIIFMSIIICTSIITYNVGTYREFAYLIVLYIQIFRKKQIVEIVQRKLVRMIELSLILQILL